MKTKERIAITSLNLFNNEGEANVTTVDIANEMDISPGNLYYHYKGKEPIIRDLFEQYETKYVEVLSAPADVEFSTEQFWFYLHILFEEIYNFRFFYENIHDILHRIPDLHKRFDKLLALQQATTELLLLTMVERGALRTPETDISHLARSMSITFTHWLSFNKLRASKKSPELLLHEGVFHIMALLAPHLSDSHQYIYQQARDILRRVTLAKPR